MTILFYHQLLCILHLLSNINAIMDTPYLLPPLGLIPMYTLEEFT